MIYSVVEFGLGRKAQMLQQKAMIRYFLLPVKCFQYIFDHGFGFAILVIRFLTKYARNKRRDSLRLSSDTGESPLLTMGLLLASYHRF